MRLSPTRLLATTTSLFVAGTLTTPRTRAYEARVEAEHAAQFYEVRSPYGSPDVLRRRHTSLLGLTLDDLAGAGKEGPNLRFRARLRLDADFGQARAERDADSDRYVPGFEQAPLDLMYAYFEAPDLAEGAINARVGRQLLVDPLGFWLFDGGRLLISLPLGLELGAYAGLEPRPGLPTLATARYTADGVSRGDRAELEDNEQPSFLDESRLSPAYGAFFGVRALGPVSAAVQYRKVENRSRVRLSPFATDPSAPPRTYGGARTSSERVSASARLDLPRVGSASADTIYDLYRDRLSDLDLDVAVFPARSLSLGGSFVRTRPSFDGDSIFNFFTQGATSRLASRLDFAASRRFDASASWGVRWFETEGDPYAPATSSSRSLDHAGTSLGATASARLRFALTQLSVLAQGEAGDRGHVYGSDLSLRRSFAGGLYDGLALISLYDWADPLRKDRNATSFGYVLGAGLQTGSVLFSRSRVGVEWEHTLNRLVGQRFRVLATLELEVFR